MASTPLLRVRSLEKVYRSGAKGLKGAVEVRALDGIDLDIHAGDYVAIVGPSGSGKSTLMQMLGLLDRPSAGRLEVEGREVSGLSDGELARLRNQTLGFVFQSFNLLPRTSATANVALPLLYARHPDPRARANAVLEQIGLGDRLDHAPHQLSGGQQQRVAIARALAPSPHILLADEPTGNLPSLQAREIMGELERMNREQGVTLLLVTHDPALAKRASRVIELRDGKVVRDRRKRALRGRSAPSSQRSRKAALGPSSPRQGRGEGDWFNAGTLRENLRMALTALALNKARTFLTVLGVIIGVAAVIAMTAVSQGAAAQVKESLASLGSNLLVSWPGGGNRWQPFSDQDAAAVRALEGRGPVKSVCFTTRGSITVSYLEKTWNSQVLGAQRSYEAMHASKPLRGRFYNEAEEAGRARVCLLGKTLISNLYPQGMDPTGTTIKINKQDYRVLGVLPARGASWRDEDDIVIMPFTTAQTRVLGRTEVGAFELQAKDSASLNAAEELLKSTLRRTRRIQEGEEDNFTVRNLGQIQESQDKTANTLGGLILAIAALSLGVGGIGIMNIMLVTVRERTREIGLRKALGAQSREVLAQFLVEAAVVGVLGGVLGVALGGGVSFLIASVLKWKVLLSPLWVALAVGVAALTGVVSGLWPAVQASRLPPTEALRYE